MKDVLTFYSNKTVVAKNYESTTSDYPDAPTTESGTYVLNSNGSVTLTYSGETTSSSFFYKVLDSYLIEGNETSADAYAYIKQ